MASGTRVHRKIQEASLGREEHKISGRKTKNRSRAKRSRRSFAEVSLDNADALIDAATHPVSARGWRKAYASSHWRSRVPQFAPDAGRRRYAFLPAVPSDFR